MMNMIDEMHCGCGTLSTTAVRIWHQISSSAAQRLQLLSKSPADLCRGLSCSINWLFYKSNLIISRMNLHNCRCYQEHQSMLLQSLWALCLAPGAWERLEELRSTDEVDRSVWEGCVWCQNWSKFCRWRDSQQPRQCWRPTYAAGTLAIGWRPRQGPKILFRWLGWSHKLPASSDLYPDMHTLESTYKDSVTERTTCACGVEW